MKENVGFYTDNYENVTDDGKFKSKNSLKTKFWYSVPFLRLPFENLTVSNKDT